MSLAMSASVLTYPLARIMCTLVEWYFGGRECREEARMLLGHLKPLVLKLTLILESFNFINSLS